MPRLPSAVEEPAGLRYQPAFLTVDEEASLAAGFEAATFEEVRMHGQAARRTVLHLGYRYDYGSARVVPTDPLPPPLLALRERVGEWAGVEAVRFVEALVTRYPPGAGIGWHRDAPRFGSTVVGVSLLSPCTMRFQRRRTTERLTYALALEPRSVYVLSGSAR